MRPGSDELSAVITASMEVSYSADLVYNDERVGEDLALEDVTVDFDSSDEVEGTGSATIVWTDEQGLSNVPRQAGDMLAPFGSRLIVYASVGVGTFVERVQLGEFTLTGVPDSEDAQFYWGDRVLSMGSRIGVKFSDRIVEVQRDRFTRLQQPSHPESVYAELQALTGFQLTRTVDDAPIRRNVIYEDERFDAVAQLTDIIGGSPFMEWDGTLSVRPYDPGEAVAQLVKGPYGTVLQVGSALDADQVYNGIIIRTEDGEQQQVLAERWIEQGPLRATPPNGERTPYHRAPRFYSNPQITTTSQALAVIDGLLERYSTPSAAQLEVQCIFNPLLQLGDVVTVESDGILWTIRITKLSPTSTPYMTLTGDVISRVVQ